MRTKRKGKPDAAPAAPKRARIPKPDDPAQSKRFVEAARQIEADESGEAFRRALEKIVPPRKHEIH